MKKLLLTLGLFFMVSAVALSQTQVLSGSWYGNSETKYYTLHENTGERAFTIEVNFLKPFENKPDVVVGLSNIDVAPGNLRYSVKAKSVSRDGFTIEVKTWGDTKIMSIGGFWVAHAENS
ncbi:MAG: H-type lectin domain-containing protein, partial [Ignavibacteriaceae bacterium]|nr:H-type lectin domain-containing protein [Ignavibacteriaceae bacterium]